VPDKRGWGHRLASEEIESERDHTLTIPLRKVADRADQSGSLSCQFGMCFGRSILAYDRAMLFPACIAESLQRAERARVVDRRNQDSLGAAPSKVAPRERHGVLIVSTRSQYLDLTIQ